jgi:hypothetical protein
MRWGTRGVGLVAQQALDALFGEALLPPLNGGPADASATSRFLHGHALGWEQDDPRPQEVLERPRSIAGDRGKR